jgi:hypothetical protein
MKTYEQIIEYISIALLVLVGILGILVTILDFIGTDFVNGPWKWLKGPLPVILLTVAGLALALGAERFVRFRQHARQIAQMESAIKNFTGAQLVEDYDELYSLAIRLVRDAKRQLRVTSLGPGRPDSSEPYRKAVTQVLKQSTKQPKPIRMDIVIGANLDKNPEVIVEAASERMNQYTEAGVAALAQIYVIDLAWGLDFLIIDDCHAMIAFPSLRGVKQLRLGLAFINQQKVVKEFASWFDEYLLRNAVTYQEFLKHYPLKVNEPSAPHNSLNPTPR